MTLALALPAVLLLLRPASPSLAVDEGFRCVFDDSPTGMVLADLDLQVLDANPAFASFLEHARWLYKRPIVDIMVS